MAADPRQELEELRRLDELERKARGQTEDPGFLGTAAISLGNWADSKAAGLRGAVRDYVPGGSSIVNALDAVDRFTGAATPTEQTRAAAAPITNSLQEKRPGAMLAGSFAGDMAAKTPLGMALLGGLDPGTLAERGTSAGLGYVGGKIGEGLGFLTGKMLGPKVASGAGNKWDIPLTVGQATQSKPAQIAESVVGNLPGGTGVMGKAHDRTFSAFNRAIADTFGSDATALTPEVMGLLARLILPSHFP